MRDATSWRIRDPAVAAAERRARVELVLREIERRFGPWVVYRLRDARPRAEQRAIPTGSLGLDRALGIGGYPRGRLTELIGPPSSGKAILAAHLLASAQRDGGFVAYVDADHQVDCEQMARCGVDLPNLFLVVPESLPEALDIAALLVESGGLDALVLGPLADLARRPGRAMRAPGEHLARVNALLRDSPTALALLTDASRVWEQPSLARAARHFASLRLAVAPLRPLVHPSGDVLGLRVRVDVAKHKLASPGRRAELEILRDRGIHREAELVDLGVATGALDERPLGLCFGAICLGKSRARAVAALEADRALAEALADAIAGRLG